LCANGLRDDGSERVAHHGHHGDLHGIGAPNGFWPVAENSSSNGPILQARPAVCKIGNRARSRLVEQPPQSPREAPWRVLPLSRASGPQVRADSPVTSTQVGPLGGNAHYVVRRRSTIRRSSAGEIFGLWLELSYLAVALPPRPSKLANSGTPHRVLLAGGRRERSVFAGPR